MNEVVCHIASYDAVAAYKLIWQLFALNLVTFAAIGGLVLIVRSFISDKPWRRNYHV